GRRLVLWIELREARRLTPTINRALHEHGSQPRHKAAAAVVVGQQRSARAVRRGEAEELPVQRVRDLAPVVAGDGPRGRVEGRPELADEVFPRAVVTGAAGHGQRQVAHMQRREVDVYAVARWGGWKPMRD